MGGFTAKGLQGEAGSGVHRVSQSTRRQIRSASMWSAIRARSSPSSWQRRSRAGSWWSSVARSRPS